MNEPQLNYVLCQGAAAPAAGLLHSEMHRMAYWEWNATGEPHHPHVIVCVHGLSRQSRDFDVLARALSRHARVICPDVVGRGASDWLADPMDYGLPRYVQDMQALLVQLYGRSPFQALDWVGTSMGGLIGMLLAGLPDLALPVAMRRLILNDVGPAIEWQALQRIGEYLGKPQIFTSVQQAAQALRMISAGFGPHTDQQWLELSEPMLKPASGGGFALHYDPDIARPYRAVTQQMAQAAQAQLWAAYDRICAQTLLIRGAQSDLLSPETAQEMTVRGPRARCVTLAGVGHAPTFVAAQHVALAAQFLLPENFQNSDAALTETALAGGG